MIWFFQVFRRQKQLIDQLNACKSKRQSEQLEFGRALLSLQKEFDAATLNWGNERESLINDITVLSDEMLALNEINKKLREADGSQLVYPYPTPVAAVKDYTWVQNCLSNYRITPKLKFLPMDVNKNLSTKEDIEKFLQWDLTSEKPYLPDNSEGNKIFVCNQFAARVWGRYPTLTDWNNIGFVLDHSGAHAYLIAITDDGRVWIIEPQSDRMWEFNSDKARGIYDAEQGYVLI